MRGRPTPPAKKKFVRYVEKQRALQQRKKVEERERQKLTTEGWAGLAMRGPWPKLDSFLERIYFCGTLFAPLSLTLVPFFFRFTDECRCTATTPEGLHPSQEIRVLSLGRHAF